MTQIKLAKRLDGVQESATLKLNALVQAMKAQGIDVVNLTAGEPDFNVPDAAKAAVEKALKENKSKYTPVPGIPELRSRIAKKTNTQQPSIAAISPWAPENVVVTNGGKQSLFNLFMAVLSPGDEVLIPSPYWLSYPEMVKLAEGKPVTIEAKVSENFKLTPKALEAALKAHPKARVLILNSPSNPTGRMYSKSELKALGQVLINEKLGADFLVVSDEIYDRIVFGAEPFCSFGEAVPEFKDQLVTVNGMSKSAAMTGWRVGWTVASKALTQAMITLQGQSTSNVSALSQWASVAALDLPEADFAYQVESFKKRAHRALEILRNAGKLEIGAPDGAFYLWVGVGAYLAASSSGKREDSMGFAEKLLEGAKVAVVPGTPFGAPEYLRLSIATESKALEEGCERIVRFLKSL